MFNFKVGVKQARIKIPGLTDPSINDKAVYLSKCWVLFETKAVRGIRHLNGIMTVKKVSYPHNKKIREIGYYIYISDKG